MSVLGIFPTYKDLCLFFIAFIGFSFIGVLKKVIASFLIFDIDPYTLSIVLYGRLSKIYLGPLLYKFLPILYAGEPKTNPGLVSSPKLEETPVD